MYFLEYFTWVLLFSDRINPRVQFEGGNNLRAGTIYFARASVSAIYSMHVIVGLACGIHVLIVVYTV